MNIFYKATPFLSVCLCGIWVLWNIERVEASEIARIPSPDKQLDIIITQKEVGATVATPYEIFLRPAGKTIDSEDPIFKIDKSEIPQAEWTGPRSITITCIKARIWHFQNFDMIKMMDQSFAKVGIALKCAAGGYINN